MTIAPSRAPSIYDRDLDRNPANFTPLSPLTFLKRAAWVYPAKLAIVHGDRVITYAEKYDRARRFAGAGIARDAVVAVRRSAVSRHTARPFGQTMKTHKTPKTKTSHKTKIRSTPRAPPPRR
jgi:fatty-acyl-CoA synthase